MLQILFDGEVRKPPEHEERLYFGIKCLLSKGGISSRNLDPGAERMEVRSERHVRIADRNCSEKEVDEADVYKTKDAQKKTMPKKKNQRITSRKRKEETSRGEPAGFRSRGG